jgi:predicted HAD superfamily Cof-like phosphohydrolase|tara:strand:- start:1025 stop:1438 length:414 start_codon:yes stop_codon:yes gene_type:complete
MTYNWVKDISDMHDKFGVKAWFEENKGDRELMQKYLAFRLAMCQEEMTETFDAMKDKDAEEVVDGLIDLCVFAIGTLDVFGVNAADAWNKVNAANMAKEPGIKEGRPNPFGLPDLLKPADWVAPTHYGNHGDVGTGL